MKYIEKNRYQDGYFFPANHATLINMLEESNIPLILPGDCYHGYSVYPDRNRVIIKSASERMLEKIEEKYINYLMDKNFKRLIPVDEDGIFYMREVSLYEVDGHAEPTSLPSNIICIGYTNFDDHIRTNYYTRTNYYIDINKVKLQPHINIYLPKPIFKYQCIGRGGYIVRFLERELSDIAGYKVAVHYHDAESNRIETQ